MKRVYKVGAYLREKRMKAGLKQKDIAEILNYSSIQFVSNIERGLADPPSKHLCDWCEAVEANKNTVFKLMMAKYRNEVREGLDL